MKIADMKELSGPLLTQAALILSGELPSGWPTPADARAEIDELLGNTGTALLAAFEGDELIGWGGILPPAYDGRVFELHPLVVRRDRQRRGAGLLLVNALAGAARKRGGLTLWLGADDEVPGTETSLRGADLYEDLPGKLKDFEPGTHQAAFYLKAGFKIIGVMPDANGLGKPDIFFARRL